MKKILMALVLFAATTSANAVQVYLEEFIFVTPRGTVGAITDGSHVSGIGPATTAVWDWDPGTGLLTSTGIFSAVFSLAGHPLSATIYADIVTDLGINTNTGSAFATDYRCIEGEFGPLVAANFCGDYTFGDNYIDDSTTVYGPGTAFSQTLAGDDVSRGSPRNISAFGMKLISWNGTDLVLENFVYGSPPIEGGQVVLSVSPVPVPAAVCLFGSALGLLGWMRRKTA